MENFHTKFVFHDIITSSMKTKAVTPPLIKHEITESRFPYTQRLCTTFYLTSIIFSSANGKFPIPHPGLCNINEQLQMIADEKVFYCVFHKTSGSLCQEHCGCW